jgi:hypothetical protein
MPSFIRVVETWVPSQDGTLLEFHEGLYHAAPHFGALSRSMCFGRGEGLPGRVWDAGRPLLLPRFEGSYFLRTPAAQAAGLRCAVALPCFRGEALAAVMVLLCGDDTVGAGAIELWHHDPRIGSDMTLVDGWFGDGSGGFEALSRDAYLPRGVGLPGRAWQSGEPVHLPDLQAEGARFLRSPEADAAGLQQGLAVPLETRAEAVCVLTVLASHHLPIARRLQRWQAGAAQPLYDTGEGLAGAPDPQPLLAGVVDTGVPALLPQPAGGTVLWPVTAAGQVHEVLVLGL